jgi:hypothetical protein
MSKETKKLTRLPPYKKFKASPTPAVLTALALLSVSLRVTDGTPAEDFSATSNAGASGLKLAAAHKSNATNNANATNKATATSNKIKFTTTTKDKVDTYVAKPSNEHSSPSQGKRHK